MQHPRGYFDVPDLFLQSRVIAPEDRVTPPGDAGHHRLPRLQLRRDHLTIVARTTDNSGGSSRAADKKFGDATSGQKNTTSGAPRSPFTATTHDPNSA
jgi:hypothetical protein